jgi:hypothetical protein
MNIPDKILHFNLILMYITGVKPLSKVNGQRGGFIMEVGRLES